MATNIAKVKPCGRSDRKLDYAIAYLKGNSGLVTFDAVRANHLRDHARGVGALIQILEHGRRVTNRAAAAYALSNLADTRAISALERTLANKHEVPKVRGYAAESLAHQHRRESHLVLMKNLADGCEEVRFWCAFALGEIGKVDTLALLESLTKNRARRCRTAPREENSKLSRFIAGMEHEFGSACQFCIEN